MLVYRIESTIDGYGPYQSSYRPEWVEDWLGGIAAPADCPPVEHDDNTLCGCPTFIGLCRWFTPALIRALIADEYRIAVYDVTPLYQDDTQVVFNLEDADDVS